MAGKKPFTVKLVGRLEDGTEARTHNSDEVAYFTGDTPDGTIKKYFRVEKIHDGQSLKVITPKSLYVIPFVGARGVYATRVKETALQISLKKLVGKLIYWA